MKVRMLVSIAGLAMPHYGITGTYSLAPGDVLELHDELAEKWIASGHAEAVPEAVTAEPELEAKEPSEYLQTLIEKKPKRAKAAQVSE